MTLSITLKPVHRCVQCLGYDTRDYKSTELNISRSPVALARVDVALPALGAGAGLLRGV